MVQDKNLLEQNSQYTDEEIMNLKSIYSLDKDFCISIFKELFNNETDKESIKRFLIIDFEESLKNFISKLNNPGYEEIFFIYLEDKIIGYCSFFPYRFSKDWKWSNDLEMGIFIKNEYRGQGIGESVLKHLENDYINPFYSDLNKNIRSGKKLILAPTFDNPSIKLYERLGFKKVDDKQYNNDGLFRMEKILD